MNLVEENHLFAQGQPRLSFEGGQVICMCVVQKESHLSDLTLVAAVNCLSTDYVTPIFPSTLAAGKKSSP